VRIRKNENRRKEEGNDQGNKTRGDYNMRRKKKYSYRNNDGRREPRGRKMRDGDERASSNGRINNNRKKGRRN